MNVVTIKIIRSSADIQVPRRGYIEPHRSILRVCKPAVRRRFVQKSECLQLQLQNYLLQYGEIVQDSRYSVARCASWPPQQRHGDLCCAGCHWVRRWNVS